MPFYHIIKVQRTKRYSRRLQPEKKRKEKDNSNKIFSLRLIKQATSYTCPFLTDEAVS